MFRDHVFLVRTRQQSNTSIIDIVIANVDVLKLALFALHAVADALIVQLVVA
jgi:hypothetical protein